ncbi:MAG TPA: PQQ-binding-like beta-propeller repeat protein [Humisphaera sp.]
MTARTAGSSKKVSFARRPLVRAAAALVAGGLLTSAAAVAADWTEYRGPANDGHSADVGIAKGFAANPKIAWQAPVGEGLGTFAVAGNTAFLYTADGGKETLVAMDAATGKRKWATAIDGLISKSDDQGGNSPRCTPAVDGENVYVLSVNLKLACLEAASGKVKWTKDIKQDMGGTVINWGNACSPVIDGDKIFVGGGGAGKSLIAFNKATGDVVWAKGDEKPTHASPVVATLHGVRQVIFFMQSGLVSLAVDDGRELWRGKFKYNVSTAASPVVAEDLNIVYCSAGYDVGTARFEIAKSGDAFTATPMKFLDYEKPKGHNVNHWSTPVYHNGYVYGIFGFKDYAGGKKGGPGAPVGCMDIKTGEFKWRQPGFGSGGGTIFVDGHLLVQGDGGRLALIEATPNGYKEKASANLPGERFWSAAIVANGKIYVKNKTTAFCIDVGGGK